MPFFSAASSLLRYTVSGNAEDSDDGLGAPSPLQFGENIADVGFDCFFADGKGEFDGDVAVGMVYFIQQSRLLVPIHSASQSTGSTRRALKSLPVDSPFQ